MVHTCLPRAQRVITDALGYMMARAHDVKCRVLGQYPLEILQETGTLNFVNSIAPLTLIYNSDIINWLYFQSYDLLKNTI